jgi:beta-barrel assembly-enhancing protease
MRRPKKIKRRPGKIDPQGIFKMNKGFLKEWLLLTAAILLTIVLSISAYMLFVPQTHNDVFIGLEGKLKGLIKKQIEAEDDINRNKIVNSAIQKIKERLEEKLENNPYKIEILVVNTPDINAFTLPGGLIVVNSALLRACDNPEDAASVIAHEMGHVVHGDSMKKISRDFGITALLTLTGGPNSSTIKKILKGTIDNKFSRQQEEDADQFGCELLEKSHIDPVHFANFLTKLKKKEGKLLNNPLMRYLSTHPLTKDRIKKAMEYSREYDSDEEAIAVNWKRVKNQLPNYKTY